MAKKRQRPTPATAKDDQVEELTPAAKDDQVEELDDDNEKEENEPSSSQPAPKTLKQKPQPKSSVARTTRSATKRLADSVADNDTKQSNKKKIKKKKLTADSTVADGEKEQEEQNKTLLFQSVFSEDDEVAILQGLVDLPAETRNDLSKYFTEFYNDVKNSIHIPVTIDQLRDKVQRLKKKFKNKVKSLKKETSPTLSNPIEEKMFELGKKIWGDEPVVHEAAASAKKPNLRSMVSKKTLNVESSGGKENVESNGGKENTDLGFGLNEMDRSLAGSIGLSEDEMKKAIGLIEESQNVEMQRRWKELRVTQLNVFAKRAKLAEQHTKVIMDAWKLSSSH